MIDLKANFRDFNPLAPKIDWFLNSPHGEHPSIECKGRENKGNDHQLRKLLIVKQILLVSNKGNVRRSVRRI